MSFPQSTLLERWASVLQKKGSSPALYHTTGQVLASFEDIERESGVWQRKLAVFPARSVIGIQLGNHEAWPAILLAIWRAGQIALCLDASLRADLSGQILQNASARALILEHKIQSLTPASERVFSLETSLLKVASGTTGTPRLIAFTSAHILADSDNICETMSLREEDVNYGAIPFSHSYGFSNLLTPLLTEGVALVVARDNFPHAMMDGLTNSRATVLAGIPVFYQNLARLELTLPASVRLCITASAPLSNKLARDFFARNQRKIHSFYGASECGGICYDATEEIDLPQGFVGKPMFGVDIEHSPETGRIVVRSRAVGLGYLPSQNNDALANGEFRPSDLLESQSSGFTITGRDSDFVNITGKKLDPQTVESVIAKIPGVTRAIVCGIPHERRGELAIAIVETCKVRREEIFSACRKVLSPWQVPSEVWLLEKIPATQCGKIMRHELAQKYLNREILVKT